MRIEMSQQRRLERQEGALKHQCDWAGEKRWAGRSANGWEWVHALVNVNAHVCGSDTAEPWGSRPC